MFKGKISKSSREVENETANPLKSDPVSEGQDGRKGLRRRMLKTGKVTYNNKGFSGECVIRDMSEGGAKLRYAGSVALPDTFELSSELDGFTVDCRVTWRDGQELGVEFVTPIRSFKPKRIQTVQSSTPPKNRMLRKPLDGS